MSAEPTTTTSSDGDDDNQVLDQLRAFGQTLEAAVDGEIRPLPMAIDQRRPSRSIAWLAAAAVLVTAGFGLGVLWQGRSESINSVGPSSEQGPGPTEPDRGDPNSGDADPNDPDPADIADNPVAEPGPSTIETADGSVLAEVTELYDLEGTAPEDRAEVVARAVARELVERQVFPGDDLAKAAERMAEGRLTIVTTLDPAVHRTAVAAIDELYPDEPNGTNLNFDLGTLTIDNRTGAIVDISGSDPASDSLLLPFRQPGSSFKTIVLAALFENGFDLDDTVRADGPCSFELNSDPNRDLNGDLNSDGAYTVAGSFRPAQSIAAVTRSSNNCAFVRLGQVVGNDKVVETSERLGITSLPDEAETFLSLPLGRTEVSGRQLAGAYAALANEGVFTTPWLIASVSDDRGNVLYAHEPDQTRAVATDAARQVTAALVSNVEAGTGERAQLENGRQAAGKTGTVSDFSDAWFVGYTERYTTAVWTGAKVKNDSMVIPGWQGFGGGLPAATWGRIMNELHRGLPSAPFTEPAPIDEPQHLKVPGEIDFCNRGQINGITDGTVLVDQDGDGQADCFRVTEPGASGNDG